jgi:type VII secretion protein EccB
MQTRRDQLQAYRYQVRRVLTALLGSDPDSPEQPMRRVATATVSGIMVAVLALVGAGFYGKIRGGSPSKWQQAGVLIVERETGSRYVYTDDQLHPVLNYASARLLLNTATVPTVQVARKSLARATRGATVGISGAPDSLPEAKNLIAGPWSVCTQSDPTSSAGGGAASGGGTTPGGISVLTIGSRDAGSPLGDRALLVRSGSNVYLVWHGKRLRSDATSLRSVGLDSQQALTVPASWLNTIPAGADLRAPAIASSGDTGPTVAGAPTSVGDVLEATGAGPDASFYVSLTDGVAPITAVEAALLSGIPGRTQTAPRRVSTAEVNSARQSVTRLGSADLPGTRPTLADAAGSPVCAQAVDPAGSVSGVPAISVGGAPLPAGGAAASGASATQQADSPTATVDQVAVAPGSAALVRRLAADGTPTAGEFLVTDAGRRYALADGSVATALGYADAKATGVPSSVLDLIPSGPALDPAKALLFVSP